MPPFFKMKKRPAALFFSEKKFLPPFFSSKKVPAPLFHSKKKFQPPLFFQRKKQKKAKKSKKIYVPPFFQDEKTTCPPIFFWKKVLAPLFFSKKVSAPLSIIPARSPYKFCTLPYIALEKMRMEKPIMKTIMPSSFADAFNVLPIVCKPIECRESLNTRKTRTNRATRMTAMEDPFLLWTANMK